MAESTQPPLPSELPVLPLRRTVAFPLTLQPLAVNRAVSIETVNRALAADRMILLLLQENDEDEEDDEKEAWTEEIGDEPEPPASETVAEPATEPRAEVRTEMPHEPEYRSEPPRPVTPSPAPPPPSAPAPPAFGRRRGRR